LRSGRLDEAVQILQDAASAQPADHAVMRSLSAAEMQRDHLFEALAAIDRALALAPDRAEYHLHRGGLLCRLGQCDAAVAAYRRAAELDARDPAAKRSLLSLYLEEGRLSDALAAGGDLLRAHPDDDESAAAVMHALSQRLNILDADYVVVHDRLLRPKRPPRPEPGFLEGLRTQGRVLQALIVRETRTRFGESRLGYGWALLEPILHILMLSAVFSLLMHGRPPIGTQFFIFYYTGLIPYYLFVHSSSAMTHAIVANGALLQLPLVTTFDVILARGLLELITDVLVAAILLAGFAAMGLAAVPADLWTPAVALIATAMLGCGCGFVNAVVNRYAKSWDKIWVQLTRVLYFFSGIFYVPAMMPDRMRDFLVWNPILQAVDWFRSGFFPVYEPHWLDCRYVVVLALLALLAGVGLERGLRHRLSEPL
jgi:ABC-type polysaccharide/polyol phosphate export permease